jgi:Glycosyl hydrolase family 20, domain 2/Carbohydrate family 9 binding domain-like
MRFILLTLFLTLISNNVCSAESKALKLSDYETKILYDNWQAVKQRKLRLIPIPKKIQFKGKAVRLSGKLAIIIDAKTEQDKIALNEINSRVMELTGKKLPVYSSPQKGFYNIIIVNKQPNFFSKEQADSVKTVNSFCRKQAHAIKIVPGGIKLAGNSPIAMIYAAVTFRNLMEKTDKGALLYPANVTDWPDYPRRLLTGFYAPYHYLYREDPEKHLENMKKYINWALRLKCNMVFQQTFAPRHDKQTPFSNEPFTSENVMKSTRLSGLYMKDRGISTMSQVDVALGYKHDANNPEVKKMMLNPVHKKYYSWGRHDLHRKKAERMANVFSKIAYDNIFVHAVDSGGIIDPELWSKRDKITREKYKNNRVQADADMFNIYIDTFRKKGIASSMVVYPYSAVFFQQSYALKRLGLADTPGNRETVRKKLKSITDFMQSLNKKLPIDIPICIRESKRKEMRKFYSQYPGRPMFIYFEVIHSRFHVMPLLPQEINCLWSAYDRTRTQNDILWVNTFRKFHMQSAACGSEYSWNTKFPAWGDLDRDNTLKYNADALAVMAERAAVGIWGDKYGQTLKDIFSNMLSFYLAYDSERVINGLRSASGIVPMELLKNNYLATRKATKAMDKVWSELRHDKSSMNSLSYPLFITYYKMVKAADVYAGVNYYRQVAKEEAIKGNFKTAKQAIQDGRKYLSVASAAYRKTMQELKSEPELITFSQMGGWWHKSTSNFDINLLNPKFSTLGKRLDKVSADMIKIFERYNVPASFKDYLNKELHALKSSDEIVVDGKLSETSWKKIAPLEKFVNIKIISVPKTPSTIKIAYDKKNIYFAGEITQALLSQINAPKHPKKNYVSTESVEIYLQPKGHKGFYQFVIDSSGGLYTHRRDAEKGSQLGIDMDSKLAVHRDGDKWMFELSIPFKKLANAGKGWKMLVALNSVEKINNGKLQISTFASVDIKGKMFSATENYQTLKFINKTIPVAARAKLDIIKPAAKDKTHSTGSGTTVTFGASLETDKPLYDLTVTANFLGKDRKPIGAPMSLMTENYMPLIWKSTTLFSKQLSRGYKGVILEIVAKYKTYNGKQRIAKKYVVLGDVSYMLAGDSSYVAGNKSGTKAFAGQFYIEPKINGKALFDSDKGSIGFTVKPDFVVRDAKTNTKDCRVLLHCGPIKPKHPTSINSNCMNIMINRRYGKMYFSLTNRKYKKVTTIADISKWKKGEWKRFDFVWDFTTNPLVMKIYVDGKIESGKIINRHGKEAILFKTNQLIYPIQLEALSTGYWDFKGAMDQLFISRQPKFHKSWSKQDGLLFYFDDNLKGDSKEGSISGQIGIMSSAK